MPSRLVTAGRWLMVRKADNPTNVDQSEPHGARSSRAGPSWPASPSFWGSQKYHLSEAFHVSVLGTSVPADNEMTEEAENADRSPRRPATARARVDAPETDAGAPPDDAELAAIERERTGWVALLGASVERDDA